MENPNLDSTEEEIQRELAGQAVAAPLLFRNKSLAPFSRGMRLLLQKIVRRDDPDEYVNAALVYLLSEGYAEDEGARRRRRVALLAAADNVPAIRESILAMADGMSDEEASEVNRIADGFFAMLAKATVGSEKKTVIEDRGEEHALTTPHSPSGSSLGTPDGAKSTSSGNSPS